MSRYRKIEVRTWSDEKFRALSGIPPSGQGLWFFLLTGPHTTAIPGLFRAGRAAMAEELDWEQEAFDEAFREVSEQGMAKADFKARLVWLPKAVIHNKPESPNVVRGWRVEMDLLPECELKREAIAGIRAVLEAMGAPYVEAFDEIFQPKKTAEEKASPKPSSKPSSKPSGKAMANQEQEQEQEQEQDKEPPHTPPGGGRRSRALAVQKPDDVSDQVWADWLALRKSKRASVTPTVLSEAQREASKAGLSLERFLTVWCIRGSQGLQADWLKPSELAQTPHRAHDREAADRANPRPQWALDAGFPNVYEARNEGCHERNAHLFRDGKRIEVAA